MSAYYDKSNKEQLLENAPIPIDVEGTNIILEQMRTNVCKIYKNDGGKATGFFCIINHGLQRIHVLMTNYHVINEDYIEKNKKIIFSINDDNYAKSLEFNGRNYYCSKKYDTIIIEIFPEKDDINDFLEMDDKIYFEEPNNFYHNESVYIIQYPKNKKVSVSYGIINQIYEYDINHYCSTEKGSSGSPIISIPTKKVIGIHKEGQVRYDFNVGTFLKYPILEFIDKINSSNNNRGKKLTTASFSLNQENSIKNNHNKKSEIEKSKNNTSINESSTCEVVNDNNDSIFNKKNYHKQESINSGLPKIDNNISQNETLIEINNKLSFLENNNKINLTTIHHRNFSNKNSKKKMNSNENSGIFKNRNDKFVSYSKDKLSKIINYDKNEWSVFVPNINFSKYKIPKAGIVGLPNNGFLYPINSLIQCLSNTKRLRKYLITKENYQNILYKKNEGMKLTFALSKILKNIWDNETIISKGVYDSAQFKKEISNAIHDAKVLNNPIQLIQVLLSSINNELQVQVEKKNELPIISKNNNIINFFDFNEVYDNFRKKNNKKKTIITDEFCFLLKYEISCNICQKIEYQINHNFNLVFNIEEILRFIKDGNGGVNIRDCFTFFYSNHSSNQFFCHKCKKYNKAFFHIDFITLPRTIIICFNRKNQKKNKIIFGEKLELKKDMSKIYYNLIAAIFLFSDIYYIAYCKNSYDNKWYKYNDANVMESSFEEISLQNNPLILFFSTNNP